MSTPMIEAGMNPDSLAKQAKAQELIRFKQEIDGLKSKLEAGAGKEEELRQACTDFEAVFIGKLWQEMQSTVPKEGYLHSNMEQMYLGMFDQPFSEHLAANGGIGLADMIYDQLAGKLQSTSRNTLAGNAEIRPLAENGKAEIKTLEESFAHPTALYPEEEQAEVSGAEEPDAGELDAVLSSGETVPDLAEGKRVDQLTPAEIQARMNVLAREIAQAEDGTISGPVTVESRPLEEVDGQGEPVFTSVAMASPAPTALNEAQAADQAWESAELGVEPDVAPSSDAESLPGPGDFEAVAFNGAPEIPEESSTEDPAADSGAAPVGNPAADSNEEGEWVSADSLGAGI